jgi:hypothetical protein
MMNSPEASTPPLDNFFAEFADHLRGRAHTLFQVSKSTDPEPFEQLACQLTSVMNALSSVSRTHRTPSKRLLIGAWAGNLRSQPALFKGSAIGSPDKL